MDIELRLLKSFVAIFECGTLSRAAERLGCTQAAMSMRLKLLETEVGEQLFRRHHHRLEPMPAAMDLYGHALKVLSAYDELVAGSLKRAPRRKLRLGLPDDYALGILPRALQKLGAGSSYDLEIRCDLSGNLATAVQQRLLDVALVTLPERPSGAAFAVMLPLVWVAATSAPPHRGDVPLAVYPEGCVFRASMLEALGHAGLPWRIHVESRTHAGIVSSVKAGLAMTAMAKGTAPEGLDERGAEQGLPLLPPIPIYILGDRQSPLIPLLQDELTALSEL